MALIINSYLTKNKHCVKSVRIRSFYGLYSVRMRENTDQENSKYKHFSCIETEYYETYFYNANLPSPVHLLCNIFLCNSATNGGKKLAAIWRVIW